MIYEKVARSIQCSAVEGKGGNIMVGVMEERKKKKTEQEKDKREGKKQQAE